MNLSIIIVNYKTAKLVIDCLESIYIFDTSSIEIIVVDNKSEDNIEYILKMKYPEIIFIQMGYNSGFARANNAAIRIANGENILLLNSDTVNIADAINKCHKLLRESNFSAAGVQLLNEDGTAQISGNYAMAGGLNYLLPLPFIGFILKSVANIFNVKKPNIAYTSKTVEVDWINGAFLMFKKQIIKKTGLLDEDFFLYAEEAEWCSRIKKNGRLCIFGELNVFHLQGESSNNAFGSEGKGYFNLFDRKGLQIMLSNFVRIRKQFGLFWFIVDLFVYFLTVPVFFVGTILQHLFIKNKYQFSQVKGYTKNICLLLKFIPRIISSRPFFYKVL
jgi:GT2 family glycosyltransferase